jgi:hypothetical protein
MHGPRVLIARLCGARIRRAHVLPHVARRDNGAPMPNNLITLSYSFGGLATFSCAKPNLGVGERQTLHSDSEAIGVIIGMEHNTAYTPV